jgi:Tfp pilus assembly protein PilF
VRAARPGEGPLPVWRGAVFLLSLALGGSACAAPTGRAPVAPAVSLGEATAAGTNDGGVSAPEGSERLSARKAIAATERAIQRNDWATAKANADEAVAADPKSVRALYYAGLCAEKLGKPADAEGLYQRALAVDPTFPEAAINLSAFLIEADRPKEAVATILPAAKAWPSDLLLQENLGLAASLAKNHETAIRAFQKLEKGHALHTETRLTYADSLLATGKRAEALTVLKAGLAQVADNEADVVPYATLLLGAGSPEDAKALVERVIKTARSGQLHVLRGRARLALNDPQGAVLDFELATKLEPSDPGATFALAEARDVLGQRAEAKKAFSAALKLGLDGENAEKAKKRVEQIVP